MRLVHDLTDPEAFVLAQISRAQPVTAYELRKTFSDSPIAGLSSSTGTIYPIVRRLTERGLVQAAAVEGDGRRTERLSCTPEGRKVVREWLRSVKDSSLLVDDPLRTRILYLDMLSRPEQLKWLQSTRQALTARMVEVDEYAAAHAGFYEDFAHENARLALTTRIQWIERIIAALDK